MSDKKEDFALYCPVKNEEARKRLGIKAGFFWTTAKKLSVAVSRCIAAMDDKGYDEDDFKKPVRVNYPVVNDLPPEGVFDTEFCNRYERGGENGITMTLIPGAVPADQFHGKAVENTAVTNDTPAIDTITDSDDTADDPLPAYAYNVNGELMADVEKEMSQPVSGLALPLRYLAQCDTDSVQHQITPERLRELHSLEMDPDSRTGSILLALQNRKALLKIVDTKSLHSLASYIGKVFPKDKQPQLNDLINFINAVHNTDYLDRGLLVKEWQKGNRVSCINRTPSGANAGGGIQSDRKMPQTILGLEFEIALGLLARKYEFDIYSLPLEIELKANAIMNAVDDPEWLATRELFVSMPGGLDYSRACIIATVKTTPENLYESPFRHREYLNKVLTETDHTNPDPLVVDIACGRSSMPMPMKVSSDDDEEKSKQVGVLADEPATAETVEPDTTEPHPDPQPLDAESSVESDKTLRERVSEQLAAERGDFVPGISDPNDPKWVHNNYSASSQCEKTEVAADDATDTADSVDHVEEFSNQPEPVADQIEPETPETEPKNQKPEPVTKVSDGVFDASVFFADTSNQGEKKEDPQPTSDVVTASALEGEFIPPQEWPTYFEYGRYEDVPNSAYHAADGISSSMLKDARISLMYFYGRYIAGTIKRETSDAFTMGSLVHSLVLEPAKFDEEYAVFPGIPAGAFTNTDSLKAFIREYNADKPKSEQLKLTGKKEELQEAIRAVKPDAIFADEHEQQWLENIGNKTVLTGEQLRLAKAMQQAVLSDSVAGYYVNHPSRSVEVSYFGMDEDTEMDVRVRPDLEITIDNERVGIDLKTISMGRVRQDMLRARLHREIIDRDYHVSAAMYCDVANLDKFYWIFVNKDEGYHWVAVVEASREEIELGRLEYRKTMLALKKAYDSGVWPAPITEQYTDNLNDYDLRRLEMLSEQV
ncbi:PD-(D/E)XK nuclease-like domain-containing protein [Salmonella enterica]|nr:PD-(D/E)XK nuclease-like domain-containing protein [Salmonella enterica]